MALIRRNAVFVGDEVVLAAMSNFGGPDVLFALLDFGADTDWQSLDGESTSRILLKDYRSGFSEATLNVIKALHRTILSHQE